MSESERINVKDILNISKDDIWLIEEKNYNVLHNDGNVVVNNKRHLIFNRYCWELFKLYPNTPITIKSNIVTVLNKNLYNADTHIKLLENIYNEITLFNKLLSYGEKDFLLKSVYKIYNDIYNNIVQRVSDSVFTIDATDFIDVINNEDIKKIHSSIKPVPESIETAYGRIKTVMKKLGSSNRFSMAFNSKAINENQANQCIGPRGFISDLDRTVFKKPVMNGFIRGLDSLYEIMVESRTAAKALNASDTHIVTSEYSSRRIQLLTMSLDTIVFEDCGSTDYMSIYVTPLILENLKGKYYLKEDNTLGCIVGNETDLVDKVIKVRGVLQCKYPIANKICHVCLGKLAENIKENSNLGYIMTSYLMEKASQSILSTKHLTHSVKKSNIQLEGNANKYFYTDIENYIYFNKDLDLSDLILVLPSNRLNKLVDVLNTEHNNIALNKIGELEELIIIDKRHSTPISEVVLVSYKDRTSILTHSLLNYIKYNNVLDTDAKGNFLVNLKNYDISKPVLYNPLKETNIISFVNKITGIIETNKNKLNTPEAKLTALFEHVIDKFKCNISILEVIVYATSVYNPYTYNYSLGRNSEHRASESKHNLFRHRSLGGLFVFEERKEIVKNASIIFNPRHRINHPMDVLFTPDKVIDNK